MKKTLSALLSVVMVLSILMGMSVPVYAAGVYEYGDYTYRVLDDGTAEIANYYGYSENIIVPSSIGKYTVTSIGEEAFKKHNKIPIKVTIEYGIKNISHRAFEGCYNLKEITIPDSVTRLGAQVFWNCTGLTNIVIPDSVTDIGSELFRECSYLKSVKLSKSITTISYGAFTNCRKLTSVTGIENVNHIDTYAFLSCSILKNIFLTSKVKTIDYGAFSGCNSLADVFYCGTQNSWNNILIEAGNEYLTQANIHFHRWDNGVVTKKATCSAEGIKTYTCYNCNETKTESIPTTKHTYTKKVIAPTCAKNGYTLHTCTTCGTFYMSDYVHTTGHGSKTYRALVGKATLSKNGSAVTICSTCDTVVKKETFYYPKTITLSTTSYTYDGKAKKPSVIIKDSKGNKISSSNYTVTYASGRKNVGKYSVKITFKGDYSGSKTLYFTINPKATTLSSVTAKSEGFTVNWKKQATQTTGYEIQYATDSKFTKNKKTVSVSNNSTTSKTISKLSAKKKYYVHIRTYKTVKVSGKSTKIYSSWSKTTIVTIKK